ncbi:STAS-like domain-containing protein [Anaerosporobacter sp.]|uniref:STAS-like domain-containing protein n=1 Tax=Anaerosporobacter sp. TaxID=1872529 RepID=UPI00286F3C8C|nr:STAS-like domain-containing protein [Anaerosporobacter sp.]
MAEKLKIIDVIGTKAADDDSKGNVAFNKISELSQSNKEILVDFEGVELVNTAFLNNAIGKLFNPREFDLVKCQIRIINLSDDMMTLLKESVKVAKLKYAKL